MTSITRHAPAVTSITDDTPATRYLQDMSSLPDRAPHAPMSAPVGPASPHAPHAPMSAPVGPASLHAPAVPPIPNRRLFVWLGASLPLEVLIAVRSAHRAHRDGETLLLWDRPRPTDPVAARLAAEGVRVLPAKEAWVAGALPEAGFARAADLFERLRAPAARSNLLRLAALHGLGGIYLDTDTITLGPLCPLRLQPGFCGSEPVSTPGVVWRSRSPLRWLRSGALHGLRAVLSRAPGGVAAFRRIEPLYHRVATNAVLGAPAGHPLLAEAFARIARMDEARATRRYALGVHLLQELTGNESRPGFAVLPPPVFYPLGPEISAHWFRSSSGARMGRWLTPETRVVHWYATTAARRGHLPLDEAWIRRHRRDVAFAALAAPHLD